MQYYNLYDIPLYLIVCIGAIVLAVIYQSKKKEQNIAYKYFALGLAAKIFAVTVFCFIYTHHYKGGDTLGYHLSAQAMVNLFIKSPMEYLSVVFGELSFEKRFFFTSNTGYPGYWGDVKAFNVVRIASFFEFFGFKSYLTSSVLFSIASYLCIWRLYITISSIYPTLYKMLFVAIILMPSTLFWGSGILKDTISLMGVSLFVAGLINICLLKKKYFSQIFVLFIGVILIISVKPYIFVGLLPPSLWLLFHNRIKSIKNVLLRFFILPFVLIFIIILGSTIWTVVSPVLGIYGDVEEMLEKAKISQEDLKRDYYDGNSFDIGNYDASVSGVMSKFPQATIAGLFRPFLWESNNLVMIVSGLENFFLLMALLFTYLRNPLSFFKVLSKEEIVIFSLIFSVIFAFSIGISTSNFGALVRFKIPLIPFIMVAIGVILNRKKIQYSES